MSPYRVITLAAATMAASWLLTGYVRRYAVAREVLDVPNSRSSHTVATPRGGGMAIVVSTVAAFIALALLGALDARAVAGLVGGGAIVAAVGFADDHRHLPRRWRLLAHLTAAALVVTAVGGLPPVPIAGTTWDLGWAGYAVATIATVWVLNLTNFMDGIDGLAAVETITVCAGAAGLAAATTHDASTWLGPVMLAAAAAGFLVWNWPPARIFMGDAGSGFTGLMLAALALSAARAMPMLLWSWLILFGAFVVDSTTTLLRRTWRGDRVYEAHRMHAYQHAARQYGHRPVTLAVAAVNVAWLFPVAAAVAGGKWDGLAGLVLAYVPLVWTAVRIGAGNPADRAGSCGGPV